MSDWHETLTKALLDHWVRHPSTTLGEVGTPENVFYSVKAAVDVLVPVIVRECVWSLADEDASHWETACGHAFSFNEDGPVENQQKFCGYCGGTLVAVTPEAR